MEIASMDFEEKNAISHIQKCAGNSPNMVLTNNKEDAILGKNARISIPKCALNLIPYAKIRVECQELIYDTYDIIRSIRDPEKSQNLEELNVVQENLVTAHRLDDEQFLINVEFVPTVPHCTLATLIGLCIRVKLHENLVQNYKLDIKVQEESHHQAADVTKQINDKERTAAAMENPDLMKIVSECIHEEY
ncbi:cytosolic iron-sulfur assembly component 2A-like [Clytia hemisphaerica]|uniref:cytosolic iron-sulfur assembly component 2A-like n=1 Tax=Clytia hemisphaerica TaxID=252671 RepID=UPI0034D60E7B